MLLALGKSYVFPTANEVTKGLEFTKLTDALLQELMKSQSREIGS